MSNRNKGRQQPQIEKAKVEAIIKSNRVDKSKNAEKSFFYHPNFRVALLLAFILISVGHFLYHVKLQENLRWWSTRTQLQKEASLYSEQAMYYRYAKRGALASSLSEIWQIFTNDQKVQHPEIINPLRAYNVYPELAISFLYRLMGSGDPLVLYAQSIHFLSGLGAGFAFLIATYLSRNIIGGFLALFFWTIGHEQVTRAWHAISLREASAMPFWFMQLFFLTMILQDYYTAKKPVDVKKNPSKWTIQQVSQFLLANGYGEFVLKFQTEGIDGVAFTNLSDTQFSSLGVPVAKQVQLKLKREKALNEYQQSLDKAEKAKTHERGLFQTTPRERALLVAYFLSTLCFMLCWQFAQFIQLTQAVALFLMFYMGYIDRVTYLRLVLILEVALLSTVFLQFGNVMLFNSLQFNFILVAVPIALYVPRDLLVGSPKTKGYVDYYVHLLRVTILFVVVTALCLGAKSMTATLFGIEDDSHIFDIFRAKFTSYSTFDTKLYLKQPEYRTIDKETIDGWRKVCLVEAAIVPAVGVLLKLLIVSYKERDRLSPVVLFHWLQWIAASLLAVLIMRLKVFASPYMCIMCALWLSPEATNFIQNIIDQKLRPTKNDKDVTVPPKTQGFYIQVGVVVALVAVVIFFGGSDWYAYSSKELEYNHEDLQNMLEWVTKNTPKDAVFISEMVLTSSLFLSADRAVTNHPHYESADIRDKTREIYKMFFCTSEKDMWNIFQKISGNNVTHLLLAHGACRMSSSLHSAEENCPQERKFCARVMSDPPQFTTYFKRVWSNPSYQIFTVLPKKKAEKKNDK